MIVMAVERAVMAQSYKLTLADGFFLQVVAGDKDALPIVEKLAKTMSLAPGRADYSIRILMGKEERFSVNACEIACRFLPVKNKDDLITKVMQSSLAVAHAIQQRGGILIHGILVEFQGQGIILAGPGIAGKTTASMRLPFPWRSLSDDAVLIAPDGHGRYFAHPWPAWRRFYSDGPGGVWNISACVPLKGFYFLFQTPEDKLDRLSPGQATAMLIESAEQANRAFDRRRSPAETVENHRQQFSIVCSLAEKLPSYRLRLTLTGEFRKLIEESLISEAVCSGEASSQKILFGKKAAMASHGIVFSGNSMYPTLKAPDYLEVVSYGNTKPRRGDVIYFRLPGNSTMAVHRVMSVKEKGVMTRGDNNPSDDRDLIPFSCVVGRVVAAKGAQKNRKVRGGRTGMLDYYYARVLRKFKGLAVRACRLLALPSSSTGILRFFKPKRLQFKIVAFGRVPAVRLKILVNNVSVGHYTGGGWHIAYPWRFWIDPEKIEAATMIYRTAQKQCLEMQALELRKQRNALSDWLKK